MPVLNHNNTNNIMYVAMMVVIGNIHAVNAETDCTNTLKICAGLETTKALMLWLS
jgi:hypothetical protein